MLKSRIAIVALWIALSCGCGGSSHTALKYRVIDLDPGITFPALSHSTSEITPDGSVVGGGGPSDHAFLFSNGMLTDLGMLPGATFSQALGANSSKVAVGFSDLLQSHACRWVNGTVFDLNPIGSSSSLAYAINDIGQVVGDAEWGGVTHATLWISGSPPIDLGTINHAVGSSRATAINRSGQIVGFSLAGGAFPHACLWQNRVPIDLDASDQSDSEAVAINDAGQIVGSRTVGQTHHATLWRNGTVTDLGVLPIVSGNLPPSSAALSINNKGQIVGSSGGSILGGGRAFIWQNGKMTDLNDLLTPGSGFVINSAAGINDDGQIIGGASRSDGTGHGVILIPQ